MPSVDVKTGSREYQVVIETGLLKNAGETLLPVTGPCKAAIVTDDNVAPLYLKTVKMSLKHAGFTVEELILPHGEQTKCMAELTGILNFLAEKRLTRRDVVISLGGGVVGDISGFAAACYLRGIDFIQIPTSLLAQVDSSVGGKVAVDLPAGKNLVGAFHQPVCVLCDPDVLRTLPDRYWTDGMGEVVKYGAIGDTELFTLLETSAPGGRYQMNMAILRIIQRCVQQKANIVALDETDTGCRMVLNFGHTIGHAIETCQHYEGMSHGEAVAVGMAVMTDICEKLHITRQGTAKRLKKLLKSIGLPTKLPPIPEEQLIDAMGHDKKMAGSMLNLVAVPEIGSCKVLKESPDFFRHMLN